VENGQLPFLPMEQPLKMMGLNLVSQEDLSTQNSDFLKSACSRQGQNPAFFIAL
jgi:hypothetical protein